MEKYFEQFRNPKKLKELQELLNIKERELSTFKNEVFEIKQQLNLEKQLPPKGYEIITHGDLVKEGALCYEPHHGNWKLAGNSVGEIINEKGYVSGITHQGYIYANPSILNDEYAETTLKIAKLMGITPIKGISEGTGNVYYYYNNPVMEDYEGLPFYNTWEELMAVVIKIESFEGDENEIDIFGNCVQIGNQEFIGKTKLEAVRKAVDWWIIQNNI